MTARAIAHIVNRCLEARSGEESQGPSEVEREGAVDDGVVEVKQSRRGDRLKEVNDVEKAIGGDGVWVSRLPQRRDEGEERYSSGCPLHAWLVSGPSIG